MEAGSKKVDRLRIGFAGAKQDLLPRTLNHRQAKRSSNTGLPISLCCVRIASGEVGNPENGGADTPLRSGVVHGGG